MDFIARVVFPHLKFLSCTAILILRFARIVAAIIYAMSAFAMLRRLRSTELAAIASLKAAMAT